MHPATPSPAIAGNFERAHNKALVKRRWGRAARQRLTHEVLHANTMRVCQHAGRGGRRDGAARVASSDR